MDNNELMHYGVMGMKWGVRRAQTQAAKLGKRVDKLKAKKKEVDRLVRARKKLQKLHLEEDTLKEKIKNAKQTATGIQKPVKKKEVPKDESSTGESDNKPINTKKRRKLSEVSDAELSARINRLELEQRYKRLMDQPIKEAAAENKTSGVKDVVKSSLETTAKEMAPQVMKFFAAKGINKLIGETAVYANNQRKK